MRTLVVGAGQVGPHIALHLAERGEHVVLASRSASGPDHPRVERRHLDATDPRAVDDALVDVDVVHLCVHASAYRPDVWERELFPLESVVLDAAARHDVHVVLPESVYAFDTSDVLDARLHVAPRSSMGRIRARLLDLRAASPARTTSVVASDFYGPGASMALGGDRVLDPAVTGRPVRPLGRVDLPHAWTFLPDLAAAMVAAGEAPATVAGGSAIVLAPVVHATQRELATAYAREAGRARVRVRPVRAGVLRAAAPFSRSMAAMAEMSYLFTEPLLVDTRASIEDLGVAPTALEDAVRRSVATRVGGPRPAVRAS
ncbi:NAD-dependent epimerase/dehydratase family protein [Aeromicrobium halocynthiae]|uniref:NAD-dependent epimerase/dehydratase family protein n=1 Tax=Aeromicrobium halocynthiae TaxID=560557 RepID=A0ABN2VUJ7_9ACTN